MKKFMLTFVLIAGFTGMIQAQEIKSMEKSPTLIQLEQTPGAFTQEALKLKAGTYVFEIANSGVDHQVGFVLAPKNDPDAHIKSAYVTKAVDTGKKERSNSTELAPGEYVYFCPLNPTPQYTLIVE